MLSYLTADEQRTLQATYEALALGAELAIEYGEQQTGEAEEVMQILFPVEHLLVELPHTTLKPSLATDDTSCGDATCRST